MDARTVDPEVLKCLPEGTIVTRVVPWGSSGWSNTRRVSTALPDGSQREYFLKDCTADVAHDMFSGEFLALQKMHKLMPESCPEPFGWGKYQLSHDTYFVVMEFLFFLTKRLEPEKIVELVANLHKSTAGTSPDKKFGFHAPTCHGRILQPNGWDENWARFFTTLLTVFYDADMKVNGELAGYKEGFVTLREHVIPRLLGALQEEGRELLPCLIHGDLWQENIGVNTKTGDPVLYDPALFYGHNEFEMGMWRTSFAPFDKNYREQYAIRFPPSEPIGEWEDRNRLYSVFFHLSHSAHWAEAAEETRLRTLADVEYLNKKYAASVTELAKKDS